MRNPPFAFPDPGTKFILLMAHPDGKVSVKANDPALADRALVVAVLRDVADRLAAGEGGAVLL